MLKVTAFFYPLKSKHSYTHTFTSRTICPVTVCVLRVPPTNDNNVVQSMVGVVWWEESLYQKVSITVFPVCVYSRPSHI